MRLILKISNEMWCRFQEELNLFGIPRLFCMSEKAAARNSLDRSVERCFLHTQAYFFPDGFKMVAIKLKERGTAVRLQDVNQA